MLAILRVHRFSMVLWKELTSFPSDMIVVHRLAYVELL